MAYSLTVTITRGGKPVTDLQLYLDTYAHLTLITVDRGRRYGLRLHASKTKVSGDHGGPTLTFHTAFGGPGDWRLFLQFQTAGKLHTAAMTVHVS
jgi:hypothetical protein